MLRKGGKKTTHKHKLLYVVGGSARDMWGWGTCGDGVDGGGMGGAPMKRLVMRWRCLRGACAYLFMCIFLFEEFF